MIVQALDSIEADICVLRSKSNTPQLVNATYLQTIMCNPYFGNKDNFKYKMTTQKHKLDKTYKIKWLYEE